LSTIPPVFLAYTPSKGAIGGVEVFQSGQMVLCEIPESIIQKHKEEIARASERQLASVGQHTEEAEERWSSRGGPRLHRHNQSEVFVGRRPTFMAD
jgi:hypothetical protein